MISHHGFNFVIAYELVVLSVFPCAYLLYCIFLGEVFIQTFCLFFYVVFLLSFEIAFKYSGHKFFINT